MICKNLVIINSNEEFEHIAKDEEIDGVIYKINKVKIW